MAKTTASSTFTKLAIEKKMSVANLDRAAALYPNLVADLFEPMRGVNGIDVRFFEVPEGWPEDVPMLRTIAAAICEDFQNIANEVLVVSRYFTALRSAITTELLKIHPVLRYVATHHGPGTIFFQCGPTEPLSYRVTFLDASAEMPPLGISANIVYVLWHTPVPPRTPALEAMVMADNE